MEQLFIPDKIKVGYQERSGTYTGKLAYVIYYDKTGKLRKEKSWRSWCRLKPYSVYDRNLSKHVEREALPEHDFQNVPMEGFVLNKGVGGQRHSYGWNARNEYIRVYDPRDFEFEISVANLLYILSVTDCTRGKGLEGKFVYAWDKTELVLLPVDSPDFKNCQQFTELQGTKIFVKDLVPGKTYISKSQVEYVYIGRFYYYPQCHNPNHWSTKSNKDFLKKKHIFYSLKEKNYCTFNVSTLSKCSNEECYPSFAELVESYQDSRRNKKVVNWELEDDDNGQFIEFNKKIYSFYEDKTNNYYISNGVFSLSDGVLSIDSSYNQRISFYFNPDQNPYRRFSSDKNIYLEKRPQRKSLYLILENGKRVKYE